MTDSGYVHDIFIIDRSGSMSNIVAGMQSGFRELIGQQIANPVRTTASLWQFDDVIENIYSFQPLAALLDYELVPRRMTAMFDAIGKAITTEGAALAALREDQRPGKVNVVIVSDGRNNASTHFTGPQAAALLTRQQQHYGWGVLYMGTNQDALKEGPKVGVATGSSLSFAASDVGTHSAYSATSAALTRSSAGGQPLTYTDEDRQKADQK